MKNILIIGGSSGIGASLIEKFKNDPNYQVISTFNRGNVPPVKILRPSKLMFCPII